ncbi:hypothetical protein BSK56_02305 [Paenibacillus borealis]|uniref:Lipoprotein n=1 Tax=Paenibacillus borealis TaxID=160799 RepID=A0ABX3HQC1_PAEBO|nr:hypothetical protein [Paenibacillus borealis]OMD53083.1 hypothetical protein BSK56_02305 [Paenibacillus borealis]
MGLKKMSAMIFIITSILTSCSFENSKIIKIPMLVYQQNDSVKKEAILGSWDINQSKINLDKGMYTFTSGLGEPLVWYGKTLILQKNVNILDKVDVNYKLEQGDIISTGTEQSYFFNDFTCLGEISDEKFEYILNFNNKEYKVDLKNNDNFKNKSVFLANGETLKNGKIIRLVFSAFYQDKQESEIILLDYDLNKDEYKVKSFSIDKLPSGDNTISPSDSILDENKLYIYKNKKIGFIDLDKEEFIELSKISEDVHSFMTEKFKNPHVERKVVPVGKIEDTLIFIDTTLYIDDKTSGMLVYAYSQEEDPIGKILIEGQRIYLFDKNNIEVSSSEFPYIRVNGRSFSFPTS